MNYNIRVVLTTGEAMNLGPQSEEIAIKMTKDVAEGRGISGGDPRNKFIGINGRHIVRVEAILAR